MAAQALAAAGEPVTAEAACAELDRQGLLEAVGGRAEALALAHGPANKQADLQAVHATGMQRAARRMAVQRYQHMRRASRSWSPVRAQPHARRRRQTTRRAHAPPGSDDPATPTRLGGLI